MPTESMGAGYGIMASGVMGCVCLICLFIFGLPVLIAGVVLVQHGEYVLSILNISNKKEKK